MSQAVAAPITGDTILAPGNSAISAVSRRAALTALAVVPAVAIAGTSPAYSGADIWTQALRAYRMAEAAYHGHLANVWNPLVEKIDRLCPAPQASVTLAHPSGRPDTFIYLKGKPDAWMWHPTVAGRAAGEKLTTEWLDWEKRCARLKQRFDFDAVDDENTRLYEHFQDAEDRLMLTPAPDTAAILTKVEILWSDQYRERHDENERLIKRDLHSLVALTEKRRAA